MYAEWLRQAVNNHKHVHGVSHEHTHTHTLHNTPLHCACMVMYSTHNQCVKLVINRTSMCRCSVCVHEQQPNHSGLRTKLKVKGSYLQVTNTFLPPQCCWWGGINNTVVTDLHHLPLTHSSLTPLQVHTTRPQLQLVPDKDLLKHRWHYNDYYQDLHVHALLLARFIQLFQPVGIQYRNIAENIA